MAPSRLFVPADPSQTKLLSNCWDLPGNPLKPGLSQVICVFWAVKPGQPTSSSSSLASSWVDTSIRPCGFAFAGAGSICSRRASPGPAELRRTGTPGSAGVINAPVGVADRVGLVSVPEPQWDTVCLGTECF